MSLIHPTAIIHPSAKLGAGVSVGPWCLIDVDVVIGDEVVLESRVHIYSRTKIGPRTKVFDGAILGADPQDLKYIGEPTTLEIGADCLIREYVTVNRGTGATGCTWLGDHVLLMAYVHVAHDCRLESGCVLANRVQLGGHVQVGTFATIGGNAAVQQFTRIGAYSFIAGTLKIERDVPPASRALGNPVGWAGLNLHALRRHGFSGDRIESIGKSFRDLFHADATLDDAVRDMLQKPETDILLSEFFSSWKGGLVCPRVKKV